MADPKPAPDRPRENLLSRPLRVVNVGLDGFADDLSAQKVPVIRLDWRPPAGGDVKLARLLSKLGS